MGIIRLSVNHKVYTPVCSKILEDFKLISANNNSESKFLNIKRVVGLVYNCSDEQ